MRTGIQWKVDKKVAGISFCSLRVDQSSGEINLSLSLSLSLSNHYNDYTRIRRYPKLFIFCWLHIQPLMPWACSFRQKTQWPLQMPVTPQCRTKYTRSLAIDRLDAYLLHIYLSHIISFVLQRVDFMNHLSLERPFVPLSKICVSSAPNAFQWEQGHSWIAPSWDSNKYQQNPTAAFIALIEIHKIQKKYAEVEEFRYVSIRLHRDTECTVPRSCDKRREQHVRALYDLYKRRRRLQWLQGIVRINPLEPSVAKI
jgi:hypothetical protein